MIIKELFDGPVGDYCIARNTVKCLFSLPLINKIFVNKNMCQLTCKHPCIKAKQRILTNGPVKTFFILRLLLKHKVAVQLLLSKTSDCDKLSCRLLSPTLITDKKILEIFWYSLFHYTQYAVLRLIDKICANYAKRRPKIISARQLIWRTRLSFDAFEHIHDGYIYIYI